MQVALADRAVPLPIVLMTGHGEIPDTVRAIQRGAVDFLTKPVDGQVLLSAVERALTFDAEARAVRAPRQGLHNRYERLTPREREVFLHLIVGQLNKQIGPTCRSPSEPSSSTADILHKLEIDSMPELARFAVDLGIDPAGQPSCTKDQ